MGAFLEADVVFIKRTHNANHTIGSKKQQQQKTKRQQGCFRFIAEEAVHKLHQVFIVGIGRDDILYQLVQLQL